MKTIPAALQAKLDQDVTTLSTCWEVRRLDGRYLRFTDHTSDILFEGDIYVSRSSYDRTAVEQPSTLVVDNLEIEGIFQDEDITLADVEAGLYDNARVRIFIVDYTDPTLGSVQLKAGFISNFTYTPSGAFRAELLGLKNALERNTLQAFSPTCRADLGDSRCRFPIEVPIARRNTRYRAGEFVRAYNTAITGLEGYSLPVLSKSFDTLTGWTVAEGSWQVVASENGVTPRYGSAFLSPGGDVRSVLFQDIDLSTMGLVYNETEIDSKSWVLRGQFWRNTTSGARDVGRLRFEFRDADNRTLKDAFLSEWQSPGRTNQEWESESFEDKFLPPGTRFVRIWVESIPENVGSNGAAFDLIDISIVRTTLSGARNTYIAAVYECVSEGITSDYIAGPDITTVAGYSSVNVLPSAGSTVPNYPATPDGSTVTDGTAVFRALTAFQKAAVVTAVNGNVLTVDSVENVNGEFPADVGDDDYFTRGVITFENGVNEGLNVEIRQFTLSSRQIRLFLPPGKPVVVGERVILSPGCDRRRDTCRNKFALPNSPTLANGNVKNFRGEPDLPGKDAVLSYPNADGSGVGDSSTDSTSRGGGGVGTPGNTAQFPQQV